jgi:hypothetical protein
VVATPDPFGSCCATGSWPPKAARYGSVDGQA